MDREINGSMKRAFDLLIAIVALLIFLIPMLTIAILVKVSSTGPVFYWSNRIGRANRIFVMPKFRSMHGDAPVVATHLLHNPQIHITKLGSFLRRTSLDELPQLWCILKGEMSFVGPRPALFNQEDLIQLRLERGIHHLVPGLTGWAQINGRDELSIAKKVDLDEEYLKRSSLSFDIKIIWLTVLGVLFQKGISH